MKKKISKSSMVHLRSQVDDFFDPDDMRKIANSILAGVKEAKNAGLNCGYPSEFTIEKIIDGTTFRATFPIKSTGPLN